MADILPDLPDDFDVDISIEDALALASKIEEMCLRLDGLDKIVPGMIAATEILIDDVAYILKIQRKA